jgi:iron complex transport system permease protein
MQLNSKSKWMIVTLVFLLPILSVAHLFSSEISISAREMLTSFLDFDPTNTNHIISKEIRFPRLMMAIIAGSGLSVAGLLMQTLFNNPLAGPYVLGINSGASLFVAISFMTGISFFSSGIGTVLSALLGAFIFGVIILSFSFAVKSHISLLLIGMMVGSFTGAFVSIIQAMSNPEHLKLFTLWAMGSLQQVECSELPMVFLFYLAAILTCLLVMKPLNTLVLGESQAVLLGINLRSIRVVLIGITAVLTGLITAFCGPIAFVGLAVPNLVKILFRTQSHGLLLLGCLLVGSVFLISCDILVQVLARQQHIPINALTSIIGAPFVIVIVLKRLA